MENKKQFLLIWRTEEKRLIFYKMIIDKNNGSKQVFFILECKIDMSVFDKD